MRFYSTLSLGWVSLFAWLGCRGLCWGLSECIMFWFLFTMRTIMELLTMVNQWIVWRIKHAVLLSLRYGSDDIIVIARLRCSFLDCPHIRSSSRESSSLCGWQHFGVRSTGWSEETCLGPWAPQRSSPYILAVYFHCNSVVHDFSYFLLIYWILNCSIAWRKTTSLLNARYFCFVLSSIVWNPQVNLYFHSGVFIFLLWCKFYIVTSWFASTVVTHDGTLLAKSGIMTGGVSGGMESRSQKWDNQAVEGAVFVILANEAIHILSLQCECIYCGSLISNGYCILNRIMVK